MIEGENLDILIGSRPLKDLEDDKKKEAVKQNVLNILKEKYDMEEEDFLPQSWRSYRQERQESVVWTEV